jgi:hypothetical protein
MTFDTVAQVLAALHAGGAARGRAVREEGEVVPCEVSEDFDDVLRGRATAD